MKNSSVSFAASFIEGVQRNPEQVEREKGVILEEARGYDTGDPFYDVKVGGTRYSERMPLGTAEEIKSMTAEKLENFYRKWYVPREWDTHNTKFCHFLNGFHRESF